MKPDREWSDWVNPLLIKELRQSLKDRLFLSCLYVFQLVLAGLVFYRAAGGGADTVNRLFYIVVWGIFFLLPLRCIFSGGISQELSDRTIEGVLLSRMGVRGIILGKWISSVFQLFLFFSILLPFLGIRYLMGEDLLKESQAVFVMFYCGSILSIICIGFSSIRFLITRIVAYVLMFFVLCFTFPQGNTQIPFAIVPILLPVPLAVLEVAVVFIAPTEAAPIYRRLGVISLFIVGWFWLSNLDDGNTDALRHFGEVIMLICFCETVLPELSRAPIRFLPIGIRCFFGQNSLSSLLFVATFLPIVNLTCMETFYKIYPDFYYYFSAVLTSYECGLLLIPLFIIEILPFEIGAKIIFGFIVNFLFYVVLNLLYLKVRKFGWSYLCWMGFIPTITYGTGILGLFDDRAGAMNLLHFFGFTGLLTDLIIVLILSILYWRKMYRSKARNSSAPLLS